MPVTMPTINQEVIDQGRFLDNILSIYMMSRKVHIHINNLEEAPKDYYACRNEFILDEGMFWTCAEDLGKSKLGRHAHMTLRYYWALRSAARPGRTFCRNLH